MSAAKLRTHRRRVTAVMALIGIGTLVLLLDDGEREEPSPAPVEPVASPDAPQRVWPFSVPVRVIDEETGDGVAGAEVRLLDEYFPLFGTPSWHSDRGGERRHLRGDRPAAPGACPP